MNFGKLNIPNGAALAPMAGATDIAMRRISARFGAAFTVSEMVSAKALCMGDKKSPRLMRGGGGNAPYGVQLFGAVPEDFENALKLIEQMNIPFDFIDVNMGCPAPKITQSGAGSALLKTPELACEIARAAVRAANVPVTVKLRLGWDEGTMTGLEIAKRCEAEGVCAVSVHARTRKEMYTPGVNLNELAKIKEQLKIPVIANGDIIDAESALFTLKNTNCDAVMIGRGAMGNPWVFEQINAALMGEKAPEPPSLEQRFSVMREHIAAMCDEKGEYVAMNEARSHAAWYMHGLRGAAALRRECCALSQFTDIDYLIASARRLQAE